MLRSLLILLPAMAALAAGDPWAKVNELKSGVEVRVYRTDATAPLVGKFDEARDDSILIVVKNEQVAIPKDHIQRLDARPFRPGRVAVESKTQTRDPDARDQIPAPNRGAVTPSTTTSSNITVGSKPDFETIYRRTAQAPKKQPEK